MNRTGRTALAAFLLAVSLPASARGDALELKKGTILKGSYEGGTAGTVRFRTAEGVQVIPTADVLAVTFTGAPAAASPQAAPPAPPPAVPAPGPSGAGTIPAGTVVLVRTVDPVASTDYEGKRFAAKLDADVAVQGTTVLKAGSTVYGTVQHAKQAGRLAGRSELVLALSEFVVDGKTVPCVTDAFGLAGQKSGKKSLGGAAVGAGLGAALGGNRNAAGKGAAVGLAASALKKGQAVNLAPGTLLEFRLAQPVTVAAP